MMHYFLDLIGDIDISAMAGISYLLEFIISLFYHLYAASAS